MNCQKLKIYALGVSMSLLTGKVYAQDYVPADSAFVKEVEALIASNEARTDSGYFRSLEMTMESEEAWRNARLKEEMSMDWNGASLLLKGAVHTWTQHGFTKEPGVFDNRHFSKEDYGVAFTPLAATWAMKAMGVKSTSSWNRLLLSNAIALTLHVGVTKGMKTIVRETRPNGEDDESFPSGHTSAAFMSATILSREYGHISPWISIGGYGCAGATQFLRMRHNNHWINDTFVGAGIGMVSANLAYFLTDKILGKDGIQTLESRNEYRTRLLHLQMFPSGLSYSMGTEWGSRNVDLGSLNMLTDMDCDASVKLSTPYNVGVNVSWFFNPTIAVEGMASISTAHAKANVTPKGGAQLMTTGRSMSMYHADVAAKFSVPESLTRRLSCRVMAGVRNSQSVTFDAISYDAAGDEIRTPMVNVPGQTRFEVGAGMSVDMLHSRNHSAGFIIDYYHTFTDIMPDRIVVSSSWKAYF